MVPILFSEEVEGTIVSPTTVVQHHRADYEGFNIVANCDKGEGTLKLINRDSSQSISYHMTLRNGLWFHEYDFTSAPKATVNRLNDACRSNLWHGRLAHAGEGVMDEIHKHVIGIDRPLKRNPLNKCGSCLPSKMNKTPHKRTTKYKRKTKNVEPKLAPQIMSINDPDNPDDCVHQGVAGQHFHMDF